MLFVINRAYLQSALRVPEFEFNLFFGWLLGCFFVVAKVLWVLFGTLLCGYWGVLAFFFLNIYGPPEAV